jgi:hypothetical protein
MPHSHARAALLAAAFSIGCVIGVAAGAQAQPAPRRATTPAALLQYAGFFHGQLVVVRGTLATRDQAVLMSPIVDRAIPLLFSAASPADGPVELRASFWDLGRMERDDPRVTSLGLDRLIPSGVKAETWPRPGEVVALTVTDAMAVKPEEDATLRRVALDPASQVGKRVTITGQFRGRNLYADLPQGPGLSQWDFVLRSADAALWVTGLRPRGNGFNLNPGARVDTGTWLRVSGVVREGKGLVWIEAQQLAVTTPTVETRNAETPPRPQMGPPPEVIFSDPENDEVGVRLSRTVRLQFSRDMNPASFKDHLRWSWVGDAAAGDAGSEQARRVSFKYDGAKRALEISLDLDRSAAYRTVRVELLEGISALDGAKMQPWNLTFTFGPQ